MPLRQLYPPPVGPAGSAGSPERDAKVDIIAVHGLNPRSKNDEDHAWDTWRTPPGPTGRLWLRDDLSKELPESRIFLYQYNATAVYGKDKGTFIDKANEVLEVIRLKRRGLGSRPIIFLCHSLGGLLVKQALINAHNNPNYTLIKDATTGIAFFGTPHNGGDWKQVSLGMIASNVARMVGFQEGDDLLETLKSGSMFSDVLKENFRHQLLEYDIVSFWGAFDDVVPRESSRIGLPGLQENIVKIDADHSGVCKFGTSDIDQDNLELVRGNIADLYGKALVKGKKRGNPGTRDGHSPYYILPSIRNMKFTGRNSILKDLQQRLFVQKECRKLAISGLGGVGKTQVALQLAYWVKEHQPDYSIFWVPALSMATFTQAYEEIARMCAVEIDADEEDPRKSVQRCLSSEAAGRWLLIVDNVDDRDLLFGPPPGTAGIHEFLPVSDTGLTLITTRFREIAVEVAGSDVLGLEEMDPLEAEDFFTKLVDKDLLRDPAAIETLLSEMTYLPLAISQAAAYLNRNKTPLTKYIELLRGTDEHLTGLMSREFRDNTRYPGSQNAVATTWIVSFERIREMHPVAANLLAFISCIEPKAIPHSILPDPESKEDMEFAIGTLSAYAFLVRRSDEDVYDMHRLVQLATRIWIRKQEQTEETLARAIQHIHEIFPLGWDKHGSPLNSNRPKWQAYFPHAFRLLDDPSSPPSQEKADLAFYVASCLQTERRFKEAVRYWEMNANWEKEHLPTIDPGRLASEHSLAQAYLETRRIKDAIKVLEHVVEVKKGTLDEDNNNRLGSEHELARAYLVDGRIRDAIGILEHVVDVQRTLDEKDDSRLTSEHGLARAYLDDGRVRDAIGILEHVVDVEKRTLDEEDDSRLTSEHMLASAYLDDGRIRDAIPIVERVVKIREKTLVEEDGNRLGSEHELARAYLANRQTEEAVRILKHVVAVKEKILPEDDISRLYSEVMLGQACAENGQTEEAIRILSHVLAVAERELDEENQDRLIFEHNLARAYIDDWQTEDGDRGQIEEAIRILEHVVAVRRKVRPEDDTDRLDTGYFLGRAYVQNAQAEEAIQLLRHVASVQKRVLGEDHADLLLTEYHLAMAYFDQWQAEKADNGQMEEAIRLLKHVATVEERVHGEDHENLLVIEYRLARAYLDSWQAQEADDGQIDEAIRLLQHVVAVGKRIRLEDDEDRLSSEALLERALDLAHGATTAKEVERSEAPDKSSVADDVKAAEALSETSAASTR